MTHALTPRRVIFLLVSILVIAPKLFKTTNPEINLRACRLIRFPIGDENLW
jgi:hypothetical protein